MVVKGATCVWLVLNHSGYIVRLDGDIDVPQGYQGMRVRVCACGVVPPPSTATTTATILHPVELSQGPCATST